MKIVINTDQIRLHGGIEKVMATKVNYWADQPDTEVYIITTDQQNKLPCYPLDARVQLIDLEVNYNRSKSYFSPENSKKAVTHYRKQKQLFKALQPDLIISPNFNFDHYWLPLIRGKAKVIKERHASRYLEPKARRSASLLSRLNFKINDFIDEQYNAIVVLNPDEQKYIQSNNAVTISNPVEATTLRADTSCKVVIAAGRISPLKRFDLLIDIWSMLAADYPDWQLHLYGQDYNGTQDKLEKKIDALGLRKSVLFKGSVNDIRIPMSKAGIYAMTSETECFPMVLLEAMSVGLPVISYDAPTGPKHIITHDSDSFLVPYNNSAIFAERLKQMMTDESLRRQMGASAKHNADRFDLTKVMIQWETLFNELTAKPNRPGSNRDLP